MHIDAGMRALGGGGVAIAYWALTGFHERAEQQPEDGLDEQNACLSAE